MQPALRTRRGFAQRSVMTGGGIGGFTCRGTGSGAQIGYFPVFLIWFSRLSVQSICAYEDNKLGRGQHACCLVFKKR
jgi:hypothetical protein